jgi:hypothetical protein
MKQFKQRSGEVPQKEDKKKIAKKSTKMQEDVKIINLEEAKINEEQNQGKMSKIKEPLQLNVIPETSVRKFTTQK